MYVQKTYMREGGELRRTLNNRLKRQRAKRQAVFLIIGCVAVTMLVLLVFTVTPTGPRGVNGNVEVKSETAKSLNQVEEAAGLQGPDIPPISLGLGGDVCFGLDVADVINNKGPAYPWTDIAPLISGYDFTAVNLEGPLCRGSEPNPDQDSYHMRGDASCAPPMAAAGVDAVCLANDHIMDYGSKGLEETLNIIRGQGMEGVGAGPSRRMAEQPLVLSAGDGAKVALLSFCDVAPSSYAAGEDSPGLSAADLGRVSEIVGQAAKEVPYVVVVFHWGTLGSPEVTSRQRELAHACVLAGADLVVGCHPHMVQGLEVWEGVPIIYSLGNLVFCAKNDGGRNGLFAGCRFDDGRLTAMEIFPLQVDLAKPAPLSGEQAERFLQEVASSSPGVNLVISPQTGTATLKW